LREQLRRRIGKGRVVGLLAVEPTRHPAHHAIENRQQVAAGGRREQHEHQAGVGLGEDVVRDEQVNVHVQVDQAVKRCTNVIAPVLGAMMPRARATRRDPLVQHGALGFMASVAGERPCGRAGRSFVDAACEHVRAMPTCEAWCPNTGRRRDPLSPAAVPPIA
jgi:hypothetical protein